MKKRRLPILCLVLLSLLATGLSAFADSPRGYDSQQGYEYLAFGRFPQENAEDAQPILWRILSLEDSHILLLSEHVLFGNRIDPDDVFYQQINGQFNQTELFRLLNGPFTGEPISLQEQERLNAIERLGYAYIAENCFLSTAFTAEEQALLMEDEELGKVFLLSAEDLKNPEYGFSSSQSRQAYGTPYAVSTGLYEYPNGSSPYWTRSQSISYPYAARCTKVDGDLGYIRCVVMNEGCRPALRLKNEALSLLSGSGTIDDPYQIAR